MWFYILLGVGVLLAFFVLRWLDNDGFRDKKNATRRRNLDYIDNQREQTNHNPYNY